MVNKVYHYTLEVGANQQKIFSVGCVKISWGDAPSLVLVIAH